MSNDKDDKWRNLDGTEIPEKISGDLKIMYEPPRLLCAAVYAGMHDISTCTVERRYVCKKGLACGAETKTKTEGKKPNAKEPPKPTDTTKKWAKLYFCV